MSATIDERVVSMQFDNRNFENNVQTSLGTIEKLKQSLNFTGAGKGLESIGSAAKSVDMSALGSGVEAVRVKFSALQVFAVSALHDIYNTAKHIGKNIVSTFATDPIKTGFAEYETKIGSIQTIMSNTSSKGTTLDDVTRVIDELNTYADKTIYNFAEMTRNIGRFTAAGVGLEESASAIQGIANLAAASGSTSQQASTAMYQLSQALASGTVKLMDWNSVVNAGMGGEKFQEALKATARDHGVAVDDIIKKSGSFRESLQKGWITADILNETLNKFTIDGAKNYAKSMVESGKWTQAQSDALIKEAQAMEDAATKVKTFTQLWDTLKESAQSGWGKTWELLVGDFEEAKELWSNVSDVLGGAINKSSDARNNVLEGALTSNWDKLIKKINEAGVETKTFEEKLKSVAKDKGYDVDKLVKKYGSLEEAFKKGKISADVLKEAVDKLGKSDVDLSGIDRTLKRGNKGKDVNKIEETLTALGYDLGKYGGDGYFGTKTEDAIKAFQELKGLEVTGIVDEKTLAALEEATTKSYELSGAVGGLIDGITELGGRELIIESLSNIFKGLMSILKPITSAFKKVFPPITAERLYELIKGFKDLTSKFKLSMPQTRKVYQTFKGLFSIVKIGTNFITSFAKGIWDLVYNNFGDFANGILNITSSIGKWLSGISDSITKTDVFGVTIDKITSILQNGIDKIKEFLSFIKSKISAPGFSGFYTIMLGIWDIIQKVGSKVGEIASGIGKAFADVFKGSSLREAGNLLNTGLFAGILVSVHRFITGMTEQFEGIGGILPRIQGMLSGMKTTLTEWQQSLKAETLLKIGKAIALLAASLLLLSFIDPENLDSALGAVTILFADLIGSLMLFDKFGGKLTGAATAIGLMNGMATAVLILSFALTNIASLGWEQLGVGLVGVLVMLGMVAFVAEQLASKDSKMMKGASGLIAMAIAVKILASACKDLSGMSWDELGRGLAAIGALLLELGVFTKISGNSKGIVSTGISLIFIGAAMKIFASAVKDFSDMSWEEIGRGLAAMAGALLAVAISTKMMPKNMFGIGAGLVITAAALMIIAEALAKTSSMGWDEIARGLTALGGAIFILGFGLQAMQSTLAGSAALLVAAIALGVLTPVLTSLGGMSWESIAKGLTALAGAILIIGIAGTYLAPIIPSILGLAGAFALIGVGALAIGLGLLAAGAGITALAAALAAGATAIVASLTVIITGFIGLIPSIAVAVGQGLIDILKTIANSFDAIYESIKVIVLGLIDVLVECIPALTDGALKLILSVMDALVTYTPQIVDKLFTFVIGVIDGISSRSPELIQSILNLATSVLSGVIDAIMGLDVDTLLKSIAGFGIVAALMGIFSAITPMIPGAIVGLLGVGAVVAELGVIIAAIGALGQIPGFNWLINEGGEVLKNIGNAIGGFVGGIIGGIAEGITSSLPQIGTDLSNFMTNLTPFIDGAKSIDESMLAGVDAIAGIILKLTAADILSGLTSWLTGGSSLTSFAEELVPFGTAMKNFSNEVSGVDEAAVMAAANAGNAMAAMAETIPNSGGLVSFFTGDNDMATFGSQLISFGTSIKSFSDQVSGIDEAAVTAAANAGKAMAEMSTTIPNSGGLVSFFSGENDMVSFGTQLVSFGTSIKSFSDQVSGIDEAAVTASANAGKAMAEMATTIPNTGGLVSFFTGDNDMATFGSQLVTFGTYIKQFSDEVSGIDEAAVTASANAGKAMSEMANSIPESGGLFAWFTGDNDMKTFGEQLVSFGGAIKSFSDTVTGIDSGAITSSAHVATAMVNLVNRIPEDVSALSTFGDQLVYFGGDIKSFGTNVSSISGDQISGVITQVNSLINMLTNMANVDFDGASSFSESLGKIGETGIDGFVNAFSNALPKVKTLGSKLLLELIAGATSKKNLLTSSFKGTLNSVVDTIRDYNSKFKSAGKYLVEGFVDGIDENTFKAEAEAAAMAKAALKAAEEALGVKSPSKEFYKIGDFSILGFANALHDGFSRVYNSSSEMGEYAKRGFSNAISKVSDILNSGFDDQPTIRPVVDLSEVTAGAGMINGLFGMNPSIGVMSNVRSISSMMNNRQNGVNRDIVDAIEELGVRINSMGSNNYYSLGDVTYDDGSNVSNAVKALVNAVKVERRV